MHPRLPEALRESLPYAAAAAVFLLVGGGIFVAVEPGWSYADATYFAFTVTTTIGYGCLVPSTRASRAVTLGYALVAIPTFAGALAGSLVPVLLPPSAWFERMLLRLPPLRASRARDRPPSALRFYARGLLPLILFGQLLIVLLLSLVVFAASQGGGAEWSRGGAAVDTDAASLRFFDAFYLTALTLTTVGPGVLDAAPRLSR